MRPIPVLIASVAVGCLALATPCAAQTAAAGAAGQTAGLRYLSWPGKPQASATPTVTASTPVQPTEARASAPSLPVRTAAVIPHGGYTPAGVPDAPPARQGLTPASAWLAPARALPPSAPTPYRPDPAPVRASLPTPQPAPEARVQSAPPQGRLVQPTPRTGWSIPSDQGASATVAAEASTAQPAADPMAPRRDAPIFRLQAARQAEATASATAAASNTYAAALPPGEEGARYYSLHRASGHEPDATPLPAPVMLDAMPVDLAAPPADPTPARGADGRARVVVANDDPNLP